LTILAVFVAVSWLGAWLESPRWARLTGVSLFAVALVLSLVPLIRLRGVSRARRLARLDRDSGGAHRPATSLEDALANGGSDPSTAALWALHRKRLEQSAQAIRLAPPRPGLAGRDRYALRGAALVALAAAGFVAGPTKWARVLAAFDVQSEQAPAAGFRLDVWINPPGYTGKPPLLLSGQTALSASIHKTVEAPVGSTVVVRSNGVGGVSVAAAGALNAGAAVGDAPSPRPASQAAPDPSEKRWTLGGDGSLVVRRYGSDVARFGFVAIPDRPPSIRLVGRPQANARGSLTLKYAIGDDYGVSGAEAAFSDPLVGGRKPPRSLVGPPKMPLALPLGARGLGSGQTTADLSEHPWAGAQVTLQLHAKDEGGNEGLSDPIRVTLPQRPFYQPIARALVEQRRNLVLDPDHRDRVSAAVDGLLIAPEDFAMPASIYLGLTTLARRLEAAGSDADLLSAADYMWSMALLIENGDATQAERDLRNAQQRLRDALQRGASSAELRKLTDELRADLDKFLNSLARQAQKAPNAPPPGARSVDRRDLQSMLDQLDRMAQAGDMAQAQNLLNQLQNLLDNLQTARRGSNPMAQRMNRALNQLDQMTRQQQALRDRTFQQGDPSSGADQPSLGDLQKQQQALRQKLEQLQGQMQDLGMDAEKGLGDADRAMRQAEGDLKQGRQGQSNAVGAQGEALDALRRGAQSFAQQMQQNGMGAGMGQGPGEPGSMREGREGRDVDPLGREAQNPEYDNDSRYDPLGAATAQRAEQVLQELRRRLGNENRPREELDYYDRLLHPY
jgi:uncharacterized protein (TIGR02302 family)